MAKSILRKAITKVVFGKCGTCGRTNSSGHTCRMKFTERNARNLKKRIK